MYKADKMDTQQYYQKLESIKKYRGVGLLIKRVRGKLIEPRCERTVKRWIANSKNLQEVDPVIDEAATEVLREFHEREAAAA